MEKPEIIALLSELFRGDVTYIALIQMLRFFAELTYMNNLHLYQARVCD